MKIALFAAFVCLAAALPNARQVQNLDNPDRVPGEFLIVLHAHVGKSSNFVYAHKMAGRIAAVSEKISIVKVFSNLRTPILHVKTSDEAVMSELFAFDAVDAIDSNLYQHMIEQCSSQSTASRLWGLSRVSSRSEPTYVGATYSYGSNDGADVTVYVLDTGININHQDFTGRAEYGENMSGDGDADVNGHGTHCAGTVGGSEFGVSKGTKLVSVKVLGDNGSGFLSWSVEALDWVVGQVGSGNRGVASMSLGGGISTAMDSAVNSADDAGVPVVVAAGNNNGNACNNSPARASGAITVGSTDNTDTLSSFSNWGDCVDILAPGSSILSASHLSNTGSRTLSGTSMACPHVAGLVATYLSDNPNASTSQVKSYLASSSTPNAINLRGVQNTPNLLQYSSCA